MVAVGDWLTLYPQAKVISFTDLAGHEKYLRTTVFGMLSSEPNYCLLMVAANNGLVGMSKYEALSNTVYPADESAEST